MDFFINTAQAQAASPGSGGGLLGMALPLLMSVAVESSSEVVTSNV